MFGVDLLVADLNHDGISDLIVKANDTGLQSLGWGESSYCLFYGSSGGLLPYNPYDFYLGKST